MEAKQSMSQSEFLRRRLSRNCNLVLNVLDETQKLMSAQEIYLWLKDREGEDGPGLTTIYRAIDMLIGHELLQSVNFGDGEKRFERIEPGEHHHHLICVRCRTSVRLESCFVDQLEQRVRQIHDFVIHSHIFEIYGMCQNCLTEANLD